MDSNVVYALELLSRLSGAVARAAGDRFADMTTPIFIGAVILILVLERIMPAKPNQAIFSVSFFQDVIWAFLEGIGQATVTLAWVMLLRAFYQAHLDFRHAGDRSRASSLAYGAAGPGRHGLLAVAAARDPA